MARIVSDKNGDYDLAHVIAVTSVTQARSVAGGPLVENPPTANLIFEGGHAVHTTLPHKETRDAWLALKAAEGHPVDSDSERSGKPS